VGRNQNFVAWTKAKGDHGCCKGIRTAGAKGKMLDTQIFRIALFEAVTFAANAIAKQLSLTENLGEGGNFFLAYDIHGSQSSTAASPRPHFALARRMLAH
jgi:hypothetical protein